MLDDETLRDGLQSPSVRCPTIEQKLEILHLIDRLGIDTADLGLPGAGPHVVRDVERLAREIATARLSVKANCAARTVDRRHQADRGDLPAHRRRDRVLHVHRLEPAAAVRRRVDDRSAAAADRRGHQVRRRRRAGGHVRDRRHHARRSGDAAPAVLDGDPGRRVARVRGGHGRACHARRGRGGRAGSSAGVVDECGGEVGIDWHGHRDRDFAIVNTLAALEAGATRLHGAAIGIGERVGNTPMDTLLVNLVLMGYIERDLSALVEYCEAVSRATGVPIPANYPVVGRDAFRTATGVHAAAVIKAYRKQDRALVDAVYSGVPAGMVGREQEVEVGPMSGRSNVIFWLEKRGLTASDERRSIGSSPRRKASACVLTEEEIREELRRRESASQETGAQNTRVVTAPLPRCSCR